jgi:hypothetical protein
MYITMSHARWCSVTQATLSQDLVDTYMLSAGDATQEMKAIGKRQKLRAKTVSLILGGIKN